MLQDQEGYLWFTTDMGVSRFDGYRFRNFNTNHGLADNTIFGIHQDQKSRIWFTSFSGKLSYCIGETIRTLPCNQKLAEVLSGTFITSIYVDAHDTIWAGTRKNFLIRIAPGWNAADVDIITLNRNEGYLWAIDAEGFVYGGGDYPGTLFTMYDRTSRVICKLKIFNEHSVPVRYAVQRISGDRFILTANKKVVCFDSKGIYAESAVDGVGICALVESTGKIRVGSYVGVYEWDNALLSNRKRTAFFDQKIITAIFRDHENGLWICTEGNGVYCVAFPDFLYYTPQDGLPQSKISCTAINGPHVLTGHLDGTLSVLNGMNVDRIALKNDVPANQLRPVSVLSLQGDTIFVSTGTAQYFIDKHALVAREYHTPGCRKLLKAADGMLWTLSYNLIFKADVAGKKRVRSFRFPLFADNIFEDRSGKLWICAINGLWSYDLNDELVYHGGTDSLLASRIVDIRQSEEGALWLVSRGNGLIVMKDDRKFHITEKDGLAGNMCRSIFVDTGNVVWVGTNQGLSRITYELRDEKFDYSTEIFTARNGLLSNEVNEIFRHQGNLWTIHTTGISIFDPARLKIPHAAPPVYITSAQINGSGADTTQHQFQHDENFITFTFIGLSYRDPGNITYRYRMDGVDSSWVYTTYTSVNFQTLPPGDYRFLVQARNTDGNWSVKPAVYTFSILPAWWQTWYFYTGLVLVGGALTVLIFKNRIDAARRKEEKKTLLQNQIATFELNALRAQMNPHFIFNSINSVQYFITNNDPDSSQKYLSKFARLIRYVVDNSKLSSIPLRTEIEALNLYLELEALRFGTRFLSSIHVSENVDIAYTQIPSMLIQPYVENAIWHGLMHQEKRGKIDITMEMKDGLLLCTIEDNGIGRKKSQELKKHKEKAGYKSVGMSNTRERLDIINHVTGNNLTVVIEDLYEADGTACGTRVKIHIPVS